MEPARTDRLSAATVLIAGDDPGMVKMIREALGSRGYTVVAATCGSEVVEVSRKYRPSVIVMDMMMPLLDGYASARVLRRDSSTRDIPIIAFNAPSDASRIRPADLGRLLDQIREALEGRSLSSRFLVSSTTRERS